MARPERRRLRAPRRDPAAGLRRAPRRSRDRPRRRRVDLPAARPRDRVRIERWRRQRTAPTPIGTASLRRLAQPSDTLHAGGARHPAPIPTPPRRSARRRSPHRIMKVRWTGTRHPAMHVGRIPSAAGTLGDADSAPPARRGSLGASLRVPSPCRIALGAPRRLTLAGGCSSSRPSRRARRPSAIAVGTTRRGRGSRSGRPRLHSARSSRSDRGGWDAPRRADRRAGHRAPNARTRPARDRVPP